MNYVNVKQRTGSVYMYVCMLMHMCVRERVSEGERWSDMSCV